MKVVVIGGTGLIGLKIGTKLNEHGHQAIAASPDTGVNTLTGEGLAEVLTGAHVIVDVSNSPSFEDGPAWDFFTTATGNLQTAAETDRYPLDELVRIRLSATNDARRVVTDPQAPYFGVVLDDHTLVAGTAATLSPTSFTDWLSTNALASAR